MRYYLCQTHHYLTMPMNNKYDRDLPQDFLAAEQAKSRQQAQNILGLLQMQEYRRKTRAQAIRAQHIKDHDIF